MAFYIKPLGGPLQQQSFPLRQGFVIGRAEGDLVVENDSKMSGRHAFIEAGADGQLYLVDNGSKNGIKLDGSPVTRTALTGGQKFMIGSFLYEIVDTTPAPPPLPLPMPKATPWHQLLVHFVKKHLKNFNNEPRAITPLHPAVVLDFVRGTQADTRWVIGYGPRRIGATSMDLPIFEPGAPDVCFELLPMPDGIAFKTDHPEAVQLNGKPVSSDILRLADVIKINDTEIEVDFIE